ncbi:MAG: hypothetical protein ACLQRH_06540 [Acidimicrobiales bacterium]
MANYSLQAPRIAAVPFDQDACETVPAGMCRYCHEGRCGYCSNPECRCPHPFAAVGRAIVELNQSADRGRRLLDRLGGVGPVGHAGDLGGGIDQLDALWLFETPPTVTNLLEWGLIELPDRASAEQFADEHRQATPAEIFTSLVGTRERNDGPDLLNTWIEGMKWPGLSVEDRDAYRSTFLREVLAPVWSAADFPESNFPRRWWIPLFRDAHYPQPDEPLAIYRGAASNRRLGMSWTPDADRARWFADRYKRRVGARRTYVYSTTADPRAVLCQLERSGSAGVPGGTEIVVDPLRLGEITRHEP